ncbi:hypothetical protein [Hansschlegelia zhihuaiae]|uniref:Lipoprotein n=1 Tax=Hansschlegelia zhihuaiae TaxID=405005 RepID=A0A4Q0MAU3_9HYPH|nr:hypothetical protein [Hansschlegelia zhihuaiae]RXF69906.1 hypothetical protein EK403_18200 [Hansschlegelia zhihuaiae]
MTRRVSFMARAGWIGLGSALCIALAACGTVNPDDPNRPTANPGLGTKLLLGNANPPPLTPPVDQAIKRDCPPIEILEGAASHRVFDGEATDPFSVRWQASIAETARECSNLGVEAGIRVGVVGRVILGPKGAPGTFSVPLRIAVVDEQNKPVYSQVHLIAVSVPSGDTKADFTKIDDQIVVPTPTNRFRGWRILVGYDPQPTAEPKSARRRG